MTDLRVGIIGCGSIARKKHAAALSQIEGVELIGFQSRSEQSAQSLCNDFGAKGAKAYVTAEELLKNPDIDVVHICTPNNSHAELAVKALCAGKHVMVEKPMAITSAEAEAMIKAANENGKKLSVSHQLRFREDVRQVKAFAENGELGEIYYAKAHAIRRRGVPTWGSFLSKEVQGGGVLIDIGCHALDMTLWLMNNYKPAVVMANTYNKLGSQRGLTNTWGEWNPDKFKVEESAFGFVTMENGATLSLEASWALNSLDVSPIKAVLCGTKGGADLTDTLKINTDRNGMLQTITPLPLKITSLRLPKKAHISLRPKAGLIVLGMIRSR